MAGIPINIVGQRFGRLIVKDYGGKGTWKCLCDCGNQVTTRTNSLKGGLTQSCGCLSRERTLEACTKHGLSKHPLYRTWINMRSRCNNPNSTKYEIYGGKGISVCDEWENSIELFYRWAIDNGWRKGLTIDRINSDSDYCPSNCRWVDYKVQANNTTQVHNITYDGKTMGIVAWSEELGISKKMLSERIRRGWSIDRAFTTQNTKTGKEEA